MNTFHFKHWVLLPLLALTLSLQAQEKEIRKSFPGVDRLQMEVRFGDLIVTSSADGQVGLRVMIKVGAKREEDAREVLERFNMQTSQSGNQLSIREDLQVKNWESRNGNMTLTFKDGTRIRDLNQLDVEYFLSVPPMQALELSNKYKNIKITHNLEANLKVTIYDGKLSAQEIRGDLVMDNKYGEAQLGSTRSARLTIYDGDIVMGNSGPVTLESKYSEIEIGNCESLDLDAYDDEISVRGVTGSLKVTDKYSDLVFGDFGRAQLDLYDTDLRMGSGKGVVLSSKYSDLRFSLLEDLDFKESYDDDVTLVELGSLSLRSKYSSFEIGRIRRKLSVDSYDDEIEIDRLEGSLESITFNGKYTNLDLNLSSTLEYRLQANTTYGDLKFDESAHQVDYYREKNDVLELRARTREASDGSPLIELTAYDCQIRL